MAEDKRTKCLLCRENMGSPLNLELHVKTVHLGMFVCTKCPKFSTLIKMRLIRHNRKVHNKDENKTGSTIGKNNSCRTEKRKANEDEANEVHSKQAKTNLDLSDEDDNDFRFECDHCWFTTETEEDLAIHWRSKHGLFFNFNKIVGKGLGEQEWVQSQPETPKTGAREHTGLAKPSQPVIIQISKSPVASGSVSGKNANLAKSSQFSGTSQANCLADNSEPTNGFEEINGRDESFQQVKAEDVSKDPADDEHDEEKSKLDEKMSENEKSAERVFPNCDAKESESVLENASMVIEDASALLENAKYVLKDP